MWKYSKCGFGELSERVLAASTAWAAQVVLVQGRHPPYPELVKERRGRSRQKAKEALSFLSP